MAEFASRAKAQELAEHIAKAIAFADEHDDFVLGAKLTDVQFFLHEHYIRVQRDTRRSAHGD